MNAVAAALRRRSLWVSRSKFRSASDLAHHIDLSQSALSQHLARLRKARIVSTRREGVTIYYRIADHDALALARALSALVAKRRGGD